MKEDKTNTFLRLLLYPFSLLYGFIIGFRNILFNLNILKQHEFSVPIISVGNITVGGTGKTPHIEHLVSLLKNEFKVATLSRGYGRKTNGFRLVETTSLASEAGDEPLQIKLKFPEITVAVDGNRVRGINKLLSNKDNSPDVILLDDAFQHRYVKPGLSVLLIDYSRPITKDYLLPYGRLRERAHHKSRANIIVMTKMPKEIKPIERRIIEKELNLFPYQTLYFSTIRYKNPVSMFPDKTAAIQYSFTKKKYSVLLVTGIAAPQLLRKQVGRFSSSVKQLVFSDHHRYNTRDVDYIIHSYNQLAGNDKVIITTEKDSVRLLDSGGIEKLSMLPVFYIPIEIDFLYDEKLSFNHQIIEYVRKNKANQGFYSKKNRV